MIFSSLFRLLNITAFIILLILTVFLLELNFKQRVSIDYYIDLVSKIEMDQRTCLLEPTILR
jgi:hypothetical protein